MTQGFNHLDIQASTQVTQPLVLPEARAAQAGQGLLLSHGFIYCADASNRVLGNGWVYAENGVIQAVGCHEHDQQAYQAILAKLGPEDLHLDVQGKLILPGLVNAHWHESFVAPCHEQPDDSDLTPTAYAKGGNIEALGSMFGFIATVADKLTEGEALAIARYSLYSQLRAGTTTLGDLGSANKGSAMAQAAIELGMRLRVSRWGADICLPSEGSDYRTIADYKAQAADWQALCETYEGHGSGLVGAMPSVMGAFGSSDQQLAALKQVVQAFDCPYATHLSPLRLEREALLRVFGRSAVQRFDDFGLLSPRLLAVHTAYATEEEYQRLKETGVNINHAPAHYGMLGEATVSETKQIGRMLQQGWPISSSTDGDITFIGGMTEAMRACHLGHNEALNDNTACPPTLALATATRFGAQALGWQDRIGSLEVGKQADLVVMDNRDWRYSLGNHPLRTLLVTGSSKDVLDVFVAGKRVIAQGQAHAFDEGELYQDYLKAAHSARQRLRPGA